MPRLLVAVTLAAIVAGLSPANAQTYPARPITIIVPLAPGG
jgi:tripartite-type tricarboxylate transporter receptor subunit TctC